MEKWEHSISFYGLFEIRLWTRICAKMWLRNPSNPEVMTLTDVQEKFIWLLHSISNHNQLLLVQV
jgi:hypothetical protein